MIRNSSIFWEGSKGYHGNRKFKIVNGGKSLELLITKNERFKIKLPKLHGSYKNFLENLNIKANNCEIAICYDLNLLAETIFISFDLSVLYKAPKPTFVENRTLGIDLNPNQICISVNDGERSILKKSFALKKPAKRFKKQIQNRSL